jgi:thioredoxin reductase
VLYAGGETAEHLGSLIAGWSDDATVVEPDEVAELRVEDETVKAVVLKDGSEVTCDAVLIHAPLRQRGRLAEALGLDLTDEGTIAVDSLGHTSVPGVYAAGDVAVAPQQVAIAIGSGHAAGLAAVRELLLGRLD